MWTPSVRERVVSHTAEYRGIYEQARPDQREEFHTRYRHQAKHQGPDNSVFGSVTSATNIDIDHAHLLSEEDWETGMEWQRAQIDVG